ncbi:hypothetical protein KPZU02_22010 [Klebsiella pneumoniae]|nr:hypothetical protein KPZU02_22010 [Klebsiella pneumoniae]
MREDIAHRYIRSEAAVVERDCTNIRQGKYCYPGLMLACQIPLAVTQNQPIGSEACTAATVTEQRHLSMF